MNVRGRFKRIKSTISPQLKPNITKKLMYGETEEWERSSDFRLLLYLFGYAKRYIPLVSLAGFIIILETLINLFFPQLHKTLIDGYLAPTTSNMEDFSPIMHFVYSIAGPGLSGILHLAIMYLGMLLFFFGLEYSQSIIMNFTSQRLMFNNRMKLLSHLHRLSLSFFDKNPIGRLVTRTTNDIESLNEMFSAVVITLVRDIILFVGAIILMLYESWQLSLVVIGMMPIILVMNIVFRRAAKKAYHKSRARLSRLNAFLAENLAGMRVVQIFNREKWNFSLFGFINNDFLRAVLREHNVSNILQPSLMMVTTIIMGLIVYIGGSLVFSDTTGFTIGTFIIFINYMNLALQPINEFANKYNIIQSALVSAERIITLQNTDDTIPKPADPKSFADFKGSVEFKNVWFAYKDDQWILKDVSFKVNPGESIAFVGATGAGKTTIISLVNRFYDIQKGQILIDGIDIKDLDEEYLREYVGTVLQDSYLFSTDIKSNIRLNNYEISDEQIEQATRFVNAHWFIKKLPMKYDEPVMERGTTFSIGQRQLLGFARAIAFNKKILILDEATSNVDTNTEIMIQSALKRLIKDRTALIIAHRLSTIHHCDRIIVMNKGQVVETGQHNELLDKEGYYYRLYLKQYQGQSFRRYFDDPHHHQKDDPEP